MYCLFSGFIMVTHSGIVRFSGRYGKHMAEHVNEIISVDLVSDAGSGAAYPWTFQWRGRRYTTRTVGLRHCIREGRVLYHIFSVTDGAAFFRLRLDTETLSWRLLEVEAAD